MGRYSANPSKQHRIANLGHDNYQISWICDRYYQGSRLRFPTVYRRFTDRAGAERFANKWNVPMPGL